MAYLANIVTVVEMNFYGGAGIDTTNGSVDANHTILQDHAEAFLSNLLKFNLDAAGWGTLTSPSQALISEWAGRYAGMQLIAFNMLGEGGTGFTRIEAEDRINVHAWRMQVIEELLKVSDIQQFLGTT